MGTAEGLFGYMAEVVGSPYNIIPPAMFIGFSGGIQHWGTICGALVAPVALISSVVADKKIRGQMLDELMAWYIQHPFPEYQPHGLNLHKVAVGSTLCHISVSKWINSADPPVTAKSKEKKLRCAGVSGDTAKKAVEILNAWADTGTFTAMHKPHPSVDTCMGCHKDCEEPFTQGKENCLSCHGSSLIDIEKCKKHSDCI
ncbi:MAG: C-GCAxxG-C-C family protein [Desulfotignum sp.]